jgi:hypothetical protein
MTTEPKTYTYSEALTSLASIFSQLNPEDQSRLAKVAAAMANIEPAATVAASQPKTEKSSRSAKRKSSSGGLKRVIFGPNLKLVLKDGPMTPREMIDPLHKLGVHLSSNPDVAERQIKAGLSQNSKYYREYSDGKVGLRTYPTNLRSVG